jgi:hypothetical protein
MYLGQNCRLLNGKAGWKYGGHFDDSYTPPFPPLSGWPEIRFQKIRKINPEYVA